MMRVLQFLFFGHVHKWETIKEVGYQEWGGEIGEGRPSKVATKYVCRCERCGVVKAFIA